MFNLLSPIMFLIDQKCVTLLTHISPITSSKIIHSKTQSLLFKKSPTHCINAVQYSYQQRRVLQLSMPYFVQATHPTSPGYFTFWTHSTPGPQPIPACKANKSLCFPPLLCITLCPSTDPKATHPKSPCSGTGNHWWLGSDYSLPVTCALTAEKSFFSSWFSHVPSDCVL